MLRKRPQIANSNDFFKSPKTPLQAAFPSHSILHSYTPDHMIIKARIKDLLEAPVANWQFNRPADAERCNEIARYIYRSKRSVDTMLYLSLNPKTNQFDVIDGIHRYTALMYIKQQIEKQTTEELDLITPNEMSNDSCEWLFNSYMILNIRVNATDGELIELFQALNKSNPIPELYVRDLQKDKRECVERTCQMWQFAYKPHFSASNKPQRPNINRDRFIDVLDAIYDKYHLTEETKSRLEQTLERTNTHIAQNLPSKLPKTVKDKCELTGCWLFIYTQEELVKML